MAARVGLIGGGHNGLVAAWLLAEQGHEVILLERTRQLGGACQTRHFGCGCYVNPGATVFGLFASELRKRLGAGQALARRFFATDILSYDPEMVVHTSAGWVAQFQQGDRTAEQIASCTGAAADGIAQYQQLITDAAAVAAPVWETPHANAAMLAQLLRDAFGTARTRSLLDGSLATLLREFIQPPAARTPFLATNVLYPMRPDARGSLLPVLYLQTASAGDGSWGLVRGGYSRLIDLLATAARVSGVQIATDCAATSLLVKDGRVTAIETAAGEQLSIDFVVSAIDPLATARLANPWLRRDHDDMARKWIPGGAAKVNLLLRRPLQLDRIRAAIAHGGPVGQLILGSSEAQLVGSHAEWKRGVLSAAPYLEVFPLYEGDPSSSCGSHFPVCVLLLFAPYRALPSADRSLSRSLLRRVRRALLEHFQVDLDETCHWAEVLTPRGIEQRYYMHRGNLDHGAMSPSNVLAHRPHARWAGGRTPIPNMFLASAGGHPGGLVSGLPAMHAVSELQRQVEAASSTKQ